MSLKSLTAKNNTRKMRRYTVTHWRGLRQQKTKILVLPGRTPLQTLRIWQTQLKIRQPNIISVTRDY